MKKTLEMQIDELYTKINILSNQQMNNNDQSLNLEIESVYRRLRKLQNKQVNIEREIFNDELRKWQEDGKNLRDEIEI